VCQQKKIPNRNYQQYLKEIWYDPNNPAPYVGPDKFYPIVKKDGKYGIGRTRKGKRYGLTHVWTIPKHREKVSKNQIRRQYRRFSARNGPSQRLEYHTE